MKTCEGCRFWSEMVAEARGSRVYALCLHESKRNTTHDERMVHRRCEHYEEGVAIDDPRRD